MSEAKNVAFNAEMAARYANLLRADLHKFDNQPAWREVLGTGADIIDALCKRLSDGEARAAAYRAVLEGMEFRELDALHGRGIEFCQALGREARNQIEQRSLIGGSFLEQILAINERGAAGSK